MPFGVDLSPLVATSLGGRQTRMALQFRVQAILDLLLVGHLALAHPVTAHKKPQAARPSNADEWRRNASFGWKADIPGSCISVWDNEWSKTSQIWHPSTHEFGIPQLHQPYPPDLMASSRSANGRAWAASRTATKMVSSPLIVPTTSGSTDWSSAKPTRCADPGGVLSTTRLPATSIERTQSRTTAARWGWGALWSSPGSA